jgi:peptidoglycan hydrolase-like protein with peptidoglycan-binding domain
MKVFLIDRCIAWLTLISGISISVVAIYYSVAGLVAIFAAAAVPIIVMGVTLEISKLVATLWLKWNWDQAPRLIKTYLTIAVIVLMFITSMGIFGFLSKAHIDQTASSLDGVARVEQIDKEIGRQNALVKRAEDRLTRIETSGVGTEANVQRQIDAEQGRINSAYDRVQSAIDEQQRIIDSQIQLFQDELTKIDQELATLQGYIDTNDIRKAQAMVGTRVDGQYGPATASAFQRWQAAKSQERITIISRIESANTNPTVKSARDEIQRIRKGVEVQIAESNTLINRLRSQLGQTDAGEIERLLTEQRTIISAATAEVDNLTGQKYQLEAETRKLEAEVGPIKFIADFIYGDRADKNTLEEAVRWMILIIVAVFDPLAIVLLLASQHSFQMFRQANDDDKLILEPPLDNVDIVEEINIDTDAVEPQSVDTVTDLEPVPESILIDNNETEDRPDDDEFVLENAHPREKAAMHRWKEENPTDSLKYQRKLLDKGVITELPWDIYVDSDTAAEEALKWAEEQASKKKEVISWMEREQGQQIKKSKEQ